MATIQYTINRVKKFAPVKQDGQFYVARKNGYIIEFTRNGRSDTVATINVRRFNDHSDSMTDYFAGSYFDNISQALRFVEGR